MDKKLKIIWLAMTGGMAAFLCMAFIVANFVMDAPLHLFSEVMMFYLKIAMTMLVLCLIPVALKYVNADRYDDTMPLNKQGGMTKYDQMCILRISVFEIIGVVCGAIYITSGDVSFFYLAVIVLLSMMFMRGSKTGNSNE